MYGEIIGGCHRAKIEMRKNYKGKGMETSKNGIKRYNLALPEELYEELQRLADERQTTVVDLIRRFIKLGLFVTHLEASPDASLIIREKEAETRLILI